MCPDDGITLLPSEAFVAADPPLKPGTMVGEYRVDRKLGAGTFGDVYAGEQPLIGKKVAIKVLHQKLSSDPEVVSRFIAEARAVNRIRHRNIIDVFSFGLFEERRHYFVMELLDGLTLRELLEREGKLTIAGALGILRGIADGLDAAHEAGITHRDLKPDNVFLALEKDGSYFPKLLDFGVAKLAGEEMAHKTATGMAIGTPRYMSPEQSRGKKVDHRSDIYALGVMIHEMLTGQPLFEGDSSMDVLLKHATEPPMAMSSVCADVPSELDAPVLAMLAKRPGARPPSASKAVSYLAEQASMFAADATLPATPARLPRPARKTQSERLEGVTAAEPIGRAASEPQEAPVSSDPAMAATVSTADLERKRGAALATRTVVVPVSPASGTLLDGDAASSGGGPAITARSESARATDAVSEAARPAVVSAPRAGRAWALTALVVAALAVSGIALLRRGEAPARGSSTAASAIVLEATPTSAPSAVVMRLIVTPSDADVLLDDHRVGSANEPIVLPRSDKTLALRVEKKGYEARTLWIVPDRDLEIPPMMLSRAAPDVAPASSSGAAAASSKPVAKPSKTSKPHVDLERPPELDRGVKKVP
jgi:serine/threonine-protein kinase